MVHRPADSRLLTNLLQQEKDYSKQLNQLLETSYASLASLAAYAAASPPPVSHTIMELTGSLAAADAALKRYSLGVDEWRETMRTLKDAEDEVGNIMRDREILVTRLIKVSKSQRNGTGSIRESLLLGNQRFPSSSSLSSSANGQGQTESSSRPLSGIFSTSTKLAAAQSELQACESHLAAKERELAQKRCSAVRDGLGARIKALADCGWVWVELGKEALRTLDELKPEHAPDSTRPSSDLSSIGPSDSVSRVNSLHNAPPPVSMAAVMNSGIFADLATNKDQPDVDQQPTSGSSATASTEAHKADYTSLRIPPPHALEGYVYDPPTAGAQGSHSGSNSGYSTPQRTQESSTTPPPLITAFHRPHTLERRITEEEIRRRSLTASENVADAISEEEETHAGDLAVVENPRFMTEARKKGMEKEKKEQEQAEAESVRKAEEMARKEEEKATKEQGRQAEVGVDDEEEEPGHAGKEKKRFGFFHQSKVDHSPSQPSPTKRRGPIPPFAAASDSAETSSPSKMGKASTTSPSKGFFGSIKNLFGSRSPNGQLSTSLSHTNHVGAADADSDHDLTDSDDEHGPARKLGGGLFRSGGEGKSKAGRWETRTDKNLRDIARKGSRDDFDGSRRTPSSSIGIGIAGRAVANVGLGTSSGGGGAASRNRTVSDVGASTSALQLAVLAAPGNVVGTVGRKLKKRNGPPVAASATVATDDLSENDARPRATTSTASNTPKPKASNRRSASVDVPTQNRRSWGDSDAERDANGGMIIDLGRRRTASEVGSPLPNQIPLPATTTTTSRPLRPAIHSPPAVASGSSVSRSVATGYASDTATPSPSEPTVARKKSLTKKRAQGAANAPGVSALPPIPMLQVVAPPPTPRSATPTRKNSVQSASSPSTSAKKTQAVHPPLPNGYGGATIIVAGGGQPSGTLVSGPGWNAQSQGQGGGLTRYPSSATSASSGVGGTLGRGKKTTVLGQGMGGSGGVARRSSLAGTSAASSAKADSAISSASSHTKVSGSVVQPMQLAPSLMSIVEDVAKANRAGWSQNTNTKKSVGGTQKPAGMMDVVKAPPSVGRKTLEAIAVDQKIFKLVGAPAQSPTRTGMYEIRAPGSVFDQPQREVESSQSSRPQVQPAVATQKQPQKQPPTSHLTPSSSGKGPLRSALRSSRSPSPVAGPSRLPQPHDQLVDVTTSKAPNYIPAPIEGILPWGSDGTLQQPRKLDKGKAPIRGPPAEEENQSGDDTTSEQYETGDEMLHSDTEDAQVFTQHPSKPVREAAPPPLAINGYAIRHEKGSSDISHMSHSTASTLVVSPSKQPSQSQSQPSSQISNQGPRRRKSVRVSLQPTFSPSPPAIEYDYVEEQRRNMPWAFSEGSGLEGGSSSSAHISAPTPVRAVVTTNGPSKINDMWADSDEEDEQYSRAKRLLTRAAKKEKDVSLMVANRV